MSNLPITNIVNISVATPQAGLGDYQINNLAILTKEVPISAVPQAGYFAYLDTLQPAIDWGTGSETYAQIVNILSQRPNPLSGGGQIIVYAMSGGQTLTQAFTALQGFVFCGGAIYGGYDVGNAEVEAFASSMQALGLAMLAVSQLTADLGGGQLFATIRNASQTFAKCFLYTIGTDGVAAGTQRAARIAGAAYMGRLFSTDFAGTNTTSTMQLKDLANVQPDPGITQTVKDSCASVGVDCYPNLGGLPKVISSGGTSGNYYADNSYNLEWLTFALEVALFNTLAESNTKIPQTEAGIATLKNAVIGILQQAVTNGYLAPGTWTGPVPFGDPATFDRNILQLGYYVYSKPLSKQSAADRAARKAPILQIGVKLAGAVHTVSAVININP